MLHNARQTRGSRAHTQPSAKVSLIDRQSDDFSYLLVPLIGSFQSLPNKHDLRGYLSLLTRRKGYITGTNAHEVELRVLFPFSRDNTRIFNSYMK
jgi:hypothetical protein